MSSNSGKHTDSNSGKHTDSVEPKVGVLAPTPGQLRTPARRQSPFDGRAEAQLRARVGELEAQLIEVAECLVDAEARAGAAQAEADRAWGVVGDMAGSRSWRYTSALRSAISRLRRRR